MKKKFIGLIAVTTLILSISFTTKKENFSQKQIKVNKNYAFCMGLYTLNYENGREDYNRKDGSIEVFFIDSLLVLDTEETKVFVENYFDSLSALGAYKSALGSDLSIAKCLDMYNSEKLDKFVKQKIKESKNW